MIAKQSIGSSFMGAFGYNLKKMNSPNSADKAELLATNFVSLEKFVVKKEVDLVTSLNSRLKKNTYHTSLNFAQGESVSNEKMLAVAKEYMEQMGFDDNPYFIFRHHDSNHPHCHILALRTRFDGSTVSDSNNYKRSEKIIRQLEKEFGLQQVADSGRSAVRAPDRDELEMVQRTGKASRKMVLQEKVNLALSESKNLTTFIAHLERSGVRVLFNQASTGRVSGITYFMDDFKAKGQALGNRFKWANIIKTIDYEQTRDSQEISQANRRTRDKYGEGISGRPELVRPAGPGIEIHHGQPESSGQAATFAGTGVEHEARFHRQPTEGDEGHGKHPDGSGEATEENEEAVDGPLLHGDRAAPGLPHSLGLKGLGIDIVPEEDNDRRRRRRRR